MHVCFFTQKHVTALMLETGKQIIYKHAQKKNSSWTKGQATVPSLRTFPEFTSLSLWSTSASQITNTKPLWNCCIDVNPISHYKEMNVCEKLTSGSPNGARANIPSLSAARYKWDQVRLLINSAPAQITLQLTTEPCAYLNYDLTNTL